MTDLAAYITENRAYLGKDIDLIESLTQAQFDKLSAVTELMGNSDLGIDNSLVKTFETIEDFENSRKTHWRECRHAKIADGVALYSDVQMAKGLPRISEMAVVDLGDFRIVLK